MFSITKRITIGVASILILLVATSAAVAEPVLVTIPEKPRASLAYFVQVEEILLDGEEIFAIIAEDSEGILQRFNLSEKTVIVDNENKLPGDLKKIKKGDKLYVYASPFSTRSIPPQSQAYVILMNLDEKVPAKFLKIEKITFEEGQYRFEDTNGEYVLTLPKEELITPFKTKNIVRPADLKIGSEILVWSEIMTLSLPAHLMPEGVMLLPEREEKATDRILTIEARIGKVAFEGEQGSELKEKARKSSKGEWLLPLRELAEAEGYEIIWNHLEKSIVLKKESTRITLVELELLDSRSYLNSETLKQKLGISVVVK